MRRRLEFLRNYAARKILLTTALSRFFHLLTYKLQSSASNNHPRRSPSLHLQRESLLLRLVKSVVAQALSINGETLSTIYTHEVQCEKTIYTSCASENLSMDNIILIAKLFPNERVYNIYNEDKGRRKNFSFVGSQSSRNSKVFFSPRSTSINRALAGTKSMTKLKRVGEKSALL